MMKQIFYTGMCLFIFTSGTSLFSQNLSPEQIKSEWKAGKTLPVSIFNNYQLPAQRKPQNDTGINILIDLNRKCNFGWLWFHQSQFSQNGYRVCGTQATLDTVLGNKPLCRVRVKTPDAEPFAWWTPPEFNVVVIPAGSPNMQQFLPAEIDVIRKFVNNGGGVIFIAERPANADIAEKWSFNKLLNVFGATVLHTRTQTETGNFAELKLSKEWVPYKNEKGEGTVRARRTFGKGRVMILENDAVICHSRDAAGEVKEATKKRLQELVSWVAAGKPPVGGNHTMPQSRSGGGGIFPDQETRADGIVAYYTKNQIPELLQVVKDDLPKVTEWLYQRLPSTKPDEPITFILSAGNGGGWAVNARLPKEVGIISNSRIGVIGIFGHEQAHTMRGPVNAKGTFGASPAHDLSGEAHAGWFQGKVTAQFNEKARERENRNCNDILRDREKFLAFDFSKHYQNYSDPRFNKGFDWSKLWWVWQKLDDKYGPTWYPRWYWVRANRWQDSNGKKQTWDETIEDMSIAVGEDLFPFFKSIGTTLDKDRFAEVEFQGEKLKLPVAEINLEPAGKVDLSPIGDYTQPLKKTK